MARDASSSGDRIAAENYFQHAEHYYRILAGQREEAEARAAASQQQSQRSNGNDRRSRQDAQEETKGADQPDTSGSEMPAFVTKKVPEPSEASEVNENEEVEAGAERAVGDD